MTMDLEHRICYRQGTFVPCSDAGHDCHIHADDVPAGFDPTDGQRHPETGEWADDYRVLPDRSGYEFRGGAGIVWQVKMEVRSR